jgi:Protein of unknown function (DUF2911)
MMKKILVATIFSIVCFVSLAQENNSKMPSPPASLAVKIKETNLTIKYHQPAVKGRKVWDDLAPYGKVWRTGANNATTFEVDQDVKIEGKALAKGKYALFTIPGEKEWVIIFNSKPAQWGTYSYKAADDVLRVRVPSNITTSFIERFNIALEEENNITLGWENVKVGFRVN